jgi:L-amino acid N-acyltransferase YncA
MGHIIMEPMTVRTADPADLPRIAAIYDEQVRTAISTFDLEPRGLAYWEARLASAEPGDHLLVACSPSDEVVGYAYSSSYRPRPAYARTREVSVYLSAEARGQGSGRLLYDDLLVRMRADGVHQVLAVIALPNDASEALHRACGFERVGVLPEVGWKFDRWIDTALWGLTL